MKIIPQTWLWRSILAVFLLLIGLSVAGAFFVRDVVLTGGLNKSDRPEQDGLAAVSPTAMVVGTTGGQAQEAGVEILKRGGNAMDAALATAMAQITLAAGSWVSFAGIANVVYYDAATGTVHNMNAAFNTVKAETNYDELPKAMVTDAAFHDPEAEGHHNGRLIPVPGFMRGIEAAHAKFGTLPFAEIFQPSITLAEEGFELGAGLKYQFDYRKGALAKFPETRKHFVKEDGTFYEIGDTFKQPYLANTLKHVALEGADYMYTGEWAEKAVAAIQSIGGLMTMEDLANYEAKWVEPLKTTHNGYDIYAHGLPAYGGVNLVEALNLIEVSNLKEKPHYSQDADSFYWLSHITRAATASRGFTYNDAAMGEALEARVTKDHAAKLWQVMQDNNGFEEILGYDGPRHSDGIVVIDEKGNMAAVLHTINSVVYGGTGLVIEGVSLPDAITNELDVARVTEPGTRLPDAGAPVLVLKDGKPFGGFSTIGAGLHPRLVSVVHSVLNYDMSPGEALAQPALGFTLNFPGLWGSLWGSYQTVSSGAVDPEIVQALSDKGLDVVYNRSYAGYVVGVTIDPKTGERQGGTIKQFGGRPVGY